MYRSGGINGSTDTALMSTIHKTAVSQLRVRRYSRNVKRGP